MKNQKEITNNNKDNPKIVIIIDGGCVQNIITETNSNIIIIDHDTDGAPPSDLFKFKENKEEYEAYCNRIMEEVNPDLAKNLIEQYLKQDIAHADGHI